MSAQLIDDDIDAALDDIARRFAANEYNFEKRRRLEPAQRRFSKHIWASIAEMGWLGVATPEEFGGLGLRLSSIAVLAEAAGSMFLNEPLVETAFGGAYLISELGSPTQKAELCSQVLDGTLRLAIALEPPDWLPDSARAVTADGNGQLTGKLPLLKDADIADVIVVRAADHSGAAVVYLVDPNTEGVQLRPYPLIDGRGAASVTFSGAPAQVLGGHATGAGAAIRNAQAVGALATAADSLGVMTLAVDITVEYLKTRCQFGRPIGTNQVLQHRAVDMHILTGEARAAVGAAARSGVVGTQAFEHHVHAAKAIVDASARKLAHAAIQLHGGIGMADEHVAGQCLRRLMVNEQLFGHRRDHLKLFCRGLAGGLGTGNPT